MGPKTRFIFLNGYSKSPNQKELEPYPYVILTYDYGT
jgi:hypothetical protein